MNIYQDIYNIVQQYIFGGVDLTASMDLVAITLSSIGCIFVFSLPFVIVWRIIRMFMG